MAPAPVLGELADDLAGASMALARRLFAGATLWCWSPPWPHHARHIAVEFVHPVIMGKRALPAEAITDPDPVTTMRALIVSGDVLVIIAVAGDSDACSVARRAAAWGAETLWIGAGPRPHPGAADHVLWLDACGAEAAYNGDFVLLYHLLWELTHVCFEHPGLLGIPDAAGPAEICVTCVDEGRLAEVQHRQGSNGATVRTARGREVIDTTLVGPVATGDLLVIHAGSAVALVEPVRL